MHSEQYSTNDIFKELCRTENLFIAWKKFSRGKRKKSDVQIFERHLEQNLFTLRDELLSGEYAHQPYAPFRVCDPKERHIHKAMVRDRVVHQLLCDAIEPFFERRFIFDSYSCRSGKGVHVASKRLRYFLRKKSCNNTKVVYVLKCDIKRFFDSVGQKILKKLLSRVIRDKKVLELLGEIINSFKKTPGKGLPLGNLTSQLFANVYLHELDHFVKHRLQQKYYLRYCDDFIIICSSREDAQKITTSIKSFLQKTLLLSLHPHKVSICTWHRGIDFVGYVHFPHCTVIRAKTRKRMMKRVSIENFSSYYGVCKHADSYKTLQVIKNKVGVS